MFRVVSLVLALTLCGLAHAKYFAEVQVSVDANNWWPQGLYSGMRSGCYDDAFTAIASFPNGGMGWRAISVDSNGDWIATEVSSNQQFMGYYMPCGDDPTPGSGDSTVNALQQTVAQLQTTLATTNATVATTQINVQTLLTAQAEPFNVDLAWSAFAFFFGGTLLLYSVAKGGGAVLSAIRERWRG